MKLLYLVAFLFIPVLAKAQQEELKLSLERGRTYTFNSVVKTTVIQDQSGQELIINMRSKTKTSFFIKEVHENKYEIEVWYDSLSMLMSVPEGEVEFRSEKGTGSDILSLLLAELKNKRFQIIMTKKGKVDEINGLDSLFESAFKKYSEISEVETILVGTQFKSVYGETAFKELTEMLTTIFPDNPVKAGEVWEHETTIDLGTPAIVTTKYELRESTPAHHFIIGLSEISTDHSSSFVESNGVLVKYHLNGNMTSAIKTDKTSGWITYAEIKQRIRGSLKMKQDQNTPNVMTIPMIMKYDLIISGP